MKILNNKFIKYLLIPILLLGCWITLSLLFSSYKSLSILVYPHIEKEIGNYPENQKLTKGKSISGEFRARENDLGIIEIKIDDVSGVGVEDILEFSLREKGKAEFLYRKTYKSGAMRDNRRFPFGFPLVKDSKGKTYQFELRSLSGTLENAVILSKEAPIYTTKYKSDIRELINTNAVWDFFLKKVYTFIINPDFLASTSIFFVPFELYVSWLIIFSFWKKLTGGKNIVTLLFVFFVFIDFLLISRQIYALYFLLLAVWLAMIRSYKIPLRFNFYLALILLVLGSGMTFIKSDIILNKISIWAYTFMIIGAVQLIVSGKKYNPLIKRFSR